jgi:tetratricopeptide (TPR) repeat protein
MKTRATFLVFASIVTVSLSFGQRLRNAEDYYSLGLMRARGGDLKGAIADFDKAIEIAPQFSAAYTARGSAKSQQGDFEGAMGDSTGTRKLRKTLIATSN